MFLKTIANFKIMIIFDLQYIFIYDQSSSLLKYFIFYELVSMIIFLNKSKQNLWNSLLTNIILSLISILYQIYFYQFIKYLK